MKDTELEAIQKLQHMVVLECRKFINANKISISDDKLLQLFTANQDWIFNTLIDVARDNDRATFMATIDTKIQGVVSKLLTPFIPASTLN